MQTLAQNFGFFNQTKPADLNGSSLSRSNCKYISMKGYSKVTFVIQCGAVGDASWKAKAYQAKTVAGASVSTTALNLDFYHTNAAASSISSTTLLTRTTASSDQVVVTSTNNTVFLLEYDAKQLNATSGYDCVGLAITSIGTASTFAGVMAILHPARYAADSMPINARAN